MKIKYLFFAITILIGHFTIAEEYLLNITEVVIHKTKENGKSWDTFGKADLQVTVYVLSEDTWQEKFKSQKYKGFKISQKLETGIDVVLGDKIKIIIYDIDFSQNDLVGEMELTVLQEHLSNAELSFGQVKKMILEFTSKPLSYEEQRIIEDVQYFLNAIENTNSIEVMAQNLKYAEDKLQELQNRQDHLEVIKLKQKLEETRKKVNEAKSPSLERDEARWLKNLKWYLDQAKSTPHKHIRKQHLQTAASQVQKLQKVKDHPEVAQQLEIYENYVHPKPKITKEQHNKIADLKRLLAEASLLNNSKKINEIMAIVEAEFEKLAEDLPETKEITELIESFKLIEGKLESIAEKERLEKERYEKELLDKKHAKDEKERLEKERYEKELLDKKRANDEKERLKKERLEKERLEKEKSFPPLDYTQQRTLKDLKWYLNQAENAPNDYARKQSLQIVASKIEKLKDIENHPEINEQRQRYQNLANPVITIVKEDKKEKEVVEHPHTDKPENTTYSPLDKTQQRALKDFKWYLEQKNLDIASKYIRKLKDVLEHPEVAPHIEKYNIHIAIKEGAGIEKELKRELDKITSALEYTNTLVENIQVLIATIKTAAQEDIIEGRDAYKGPIRKINNAAKEVYKMFRYYGEENESQGNDKISTLLEKLRTIPSENYKGTIEKTEKVLEQIHEYKKKHDALVEELLALAKELISYTQKDIDDASLKLEEYISTDPTFAIPIFANVKKENKKVNAFFAIVYEVPLFKDTYQDYQKTEATLEQYVRVLELCQQAHQDATLNGNMQNMQENLEEAKKVAADNQVLLGAINFYGGKREEFTKVDSILRKLKAELIVRIEKASQQAAANGFDSFRDQYQKAIPNRMDMLNYPDKYKDQIMANAKFPVVSWTKKGWFLKHGNDMFSYVWDQKIWERFREMELEHFKIFRDYRDEIASKHGLTKDGHIDWKYPGLVDVEFVAVIDGTDYFTPEVDLLDRYGKVIGKIKGDPIQIVNARVIGLKSRYFTLWLDGTDQ